MKGHTDSALNMVNMVENVSGSDETSIVALELASIKKLELERWTILEWYYGGM